MTEKRQTSKAILSAFYNISQRNFGILLILWCAFKLWWNFCLDQNFSYKGKGPLKMFIHTLQITRQHVSHFYLACVEIRFCCKLQQFCCSYYSSLIQNNTNIGILFPINYNHFQKLLRHLRFYTISGYMHIMTNIHISSPSPFNVVYSIPHQSKMRPETQHWQGGWKFVKIIGS
jgi:hypothetical protein